MAKKALVLKAAKTPKFKVRGYTRCTRCGRPHSVYRKFGLCRICLRETDDLTAGACTDRAACEERIAPLFTEDEVQR